MSKSPYGGVHLKPMLAVFCSFLAIWSQTELSAILSKPERKIKGVNKNINKEISRSKIIKTIDSKVIICCPSQNSDKRDLIQQIWKGCNLRLFWNPCPSPVHMNSCKHTLSTLIIPCLHTPLSQQLIENTPIHFFTFKA